jgi:hypothetical protein
MEKELIDKLRKIAEEFGNDYLWYLDEILQEYRSINSYASKETRSVSDNKAEKKLCLYFTRCMRKIRCMNHCTTTEFHTCYKA